MPILYAIIPVLNEAANIPNLFQALQQLSLTFQDRHELAVIMIDDGSTDDTAAQINTYRQDLNLVLLQHDVNQGPGRAFGTAFQYLASRLSDDDWVLTMEGDNTSRHELVQIMLNRAITEDYEVVLASPYMYGGGIINTNSWRVLLSKVANVFVKEILGLQGIVTASSFFRLYRASVIQRLQQQYGEAIVERAGFECMVELLIKMINLRLRISEVPMVLDTSSRIGKSKMKVWRTIRGYFALFFRLRQWRV
jgi:dolichol-phosphate mannosyltransferase